MGFQSKTIIGAACPERELKLTAAILNDAFPKHNHKVRDLEEGISPRALKQTDYNRASYPYGVCEVYIQQHNLKPVMAAALDAVFHPCIWVPRNLTA